MNRPDPKFNCEDEVEFEVNGNIMKGKIGIIDYRGREKDLYMGCDWSYDIWSENRYDGKPCLYKHIPECMVRALVN